MPLLRLSHNQNQIIMYNVVLSPIAPEKLIQAISERVTANILRAVNLDHPPTDKTEQFFNVRETAKFLNTSVPNIYRKVKAGKLHAIKRGQRLYFSRLVLNEYAKTLKQNSNLSTF